MSARRIFESPGHLADAIGSSLGTSGWVSVDQQAIDRFAVATGDDQWIHVDPERAADGPYGMTIAHGYLVLSLLPALAAEVYTVRGVRAAVNYGLDRVRFPAPVRSGSRVRAAFELVSADTRSDSAVRIVVRGTVEVEGEARPACVADTIRHLMPEPAPVTA
ncbi:MaoC family dehydratase [Knoellia locipacati]|uniref:MaoC family dehydratase n=1 Tax=Knoellia locipacati TaxID=882824 RepID=UPI00384BA9C6